VKDPSLPGSTGLADATGEHVTIAAATAAVRAVVSPRFMIAPEVGRQQVAGAVISGLG
jgi:hypothetical protein